MLNKFSIGQYRNLLPIIMLSSLLRDQSRSSDTIFLTNIVSDVAPDYLRNHFPKTVQSTTIYTLLEVEII
jgi:hypothetical protein